MKKKTTMGPAKTTFTCFSSYLLFTPIFQLMLGFRLCPVFGIVFLSLCLLLCLNKYKWIKTPTMTINKEKGKWRQLWDKQKPYLQCPVSQVYQCKGWRLRRNAPTSVPCKEKILIFLFTLVPFIFLFSQIITTLIRSICLIWPFFLWLSHVRGNWDFFWAASVQGGVLGLVGEALGRLVSL